MRSTLVTGSLVASAVLLLVLPGLTLRPRPARSVALPAVSASSTASTVSPVPLAWVPMPWAEPALPAVRAGAWDDALATLAAEAPPPREDQGRSHFLRGVVLLRAGRPLEALAPLADGARWADRARSPLAARAWFLLGTAHEELADPAGAARAFERCEDRGRGTTMGEMARVRRGLALAASGAPARAIEVLATLVSEAAVSAPSGGDPEGVRQVRLAAVAAAAPLAQATGNEGLARAARRVLLLDYPCSPAARALAGDATAARERVRELGADAVFGRCEQLVDEGCARDALDDLAALDDAAPSDRVELLTGRALRATGSAADALVHLDDVGLTDPGLASRAALESALASRALGKSRDARRFLKACAEGPATPARDEAAFTLAVENESAGRLAAARDLWRAVARDGADSKARAKAAWKVAWSQYRSGLKSAALVTCDALAASEPGAREAAAARYWAARIVKDRGDHDGAEARLAALARDFPRDYYGLVAAEESGVDALPCDACTSSDTNVALAATLGRVAATDAQASAAAAELLALGLVDEALDELRHARIPPGTDAALALGESRVLVLAMAGRRPAALRAFREALPDWRSRTDVAPAVWCAAYPLVFDDLVVANCRERGLDPALVCGLIHQESVFDPGAVSRVGARGLMQVMPATGRTIAHWFDERVTTAELEDPGRNVRYGTEYLRRLLDETGHVEVALAGYNAGGGRARKWWKQTGGDVPLFVESIPFDETRDYVKAITWSSRMYRSAWQAALEPGLGTARDPEIGERADLRGTPAAALTPSSVAPAVAR